MRWAQDMTDADQEREIVFWRSLPVWRKIEIIDELYALTEQLALADLRRAYPRESVEQLQQRLIERRRILAQVGNATK
jgi:hypothetical protein